MVTRLLRMVMGPPTKDSQEMIKACFRIEELIIKQALPLQILMLKEEETKRWLERVEEIDMIEVEGPLTAAEEEFLFEMAGSRIVIIEPVFSEDRKLVEYRKVEKRGRSVCMA